MRLSDRARALKRDALTLWIAARDPRTPPAPKIMAGLVAAYAFSPIDLIPDVIPVLGLIDDLVIVPLGVLVVLRLIGEPLLSESRNAAAVLAERPVSGAVATSIIMLWVTAIAAALYYMLR